MPPYAGQVDAEATTDGDAYYADVIPSKPELVEDEIQQQPEQQPEQEQPNLTDTDVDDDDDDDNKSNASSISDISRGLEMLLDFNPCVALTSIPGSMQSAVFKVRTCNHCGKSCNKVNGYIKQMKGEEKIYFHKWCGQVNEWKEVHSTQWQNVMSGLLGHFRAIELAEQRELEAVEAARLEQVRRREEEERLQLEEQARLQAEEEAELAKATKKPSFAQKMGRTIKSVKQSLNCRGNNKAVQEQ